MSAAIGAVLLDTGPWVALHCRDDAHHRWARAQFAQLQALLDRGVVRIGLSLQDEITAVQSLFKRYDNVPASRVFTLDSDFHIYRQHGRRVIPLIQPG